LAEKIGVAFATVNRWENGQSKPSTLTWKLIMDLEAKSGTSGPIEPVHDASPSGPQRIDFFSDPNAVKAIVESHRLSHGYLSNPTFATESSMVDPLPHQRMAVYDHMLGRDRLRFLLADDAGAGKTIMTGLYIKEMLSRRLVNRVLIVPPAGLLGNWRSEMQKLFGLDFRIVRGSDVQNGNPFMDEDSDMVIVSMDTLAGERTFSRLKENIVPYDLVVFDEAHKLSADLDLDKRTVRKTDRYRLAEALAGVMGLDERWSLPWCANHLLLLTATPHMGKDTPYYYLWRLLEPTILLNKEAFDQYPNEQRKEHFIRRTKEEMVRFDGSKIYPARECHTASYALTEGPGGERELYEATTHYIEEIYNTAGILNRTAAALAGSVFQRRMASSTYALKRSFERRAEKLQSLVDKLVSGEMNEEKLQTQQNRLKLRDDFEDRTGDEETSEGGVEQNERDEESLMDAMIHFNVEQLKAEKAEVERLQRMAETVLAQGTESKFVRLQELLTDDKHRHEKVIIFTEHRDTLAHLQLELEKRGHTGRVAAIHGGMDFSQREEQIKFFRKDHAADGAQYLIATDAAGEGINLQFCWIMVNYDIPWNPARLEQRMGRIHRYGQKHDPVVIMNMISSNTREGKVMQTLLDKMEKIRKEMGSDKVFDVIGRVFEGVSIRDIMAMALCDEESAEGMILGHLTGEQVRAIKAKEESLYGTGGDVAKHLPEERAKLSQEEYRYLLPAYVSSFLEAALPLLDIAWEGDIRGVFSILPRKVKAFDRILPLLDSYPEDVHGRMSTNRVDGNRAIFLRPGEIVFDRICDLLEERCAAMALRGGLFIDPSAKEPYYFHLAKLRVVRKADANITNLSRGVIVEERLVAVVQDASGSMNVAPLEKLLLLRGSEARDIKALEMMTRGESLSGKVPTFLAQSVLSDMLRTCHERVSKLNFAKQEFVLKGFNLKEAELARLRTKLGLKRGDLDAAEELAKVKALQRGLEAQKAAVKNALDHEVDLLEAEPVQMIAHALVMPSSDPEDWKRYDTDIEAMSMALVRSIEESEGARVLDVHKPELAVKAGLQGYPGFDLLSRRPNGEERGIEVKGRAGGGAVEITENEWDRAANLRQKYWLYAVFDCESGAPRLVKVQDPAFRLSFSVKGSFLINEGELVRVAGQNKEVREVC
jgi:superfamily II DNA or RNA helicase